MQLFTFCEQEDCKRREEKNKPLGAHILTHLRFNGVCYSFITGKKGANEASVKYCFKVYSQTVMLCNAAYSKKTTRSHTKL